MYNLIPEVKSISAKGNKDHEFSRLRFDLPGPEYERLIRYKLWDLPSLECSFGKTGSEPGLLDVRVSEGFSETRLPDDLTAESLANAVSTLKQLFSRDGAGWRVGKVTIFDYPSVAIRSLSTTFAWYAGYGRIGFDSQLWGFEEWKEFLNIASDFKINQLNLCMYGYWPFAFPEYPETCLKDIPLKVWNPESRHYIDILYTHPNLANEFLSRLIEYAHLLSIRIFTYNGGFSNIHRDKRMKLPPGSKYVNDFDSLCVSDPQNIEYLKKAMRRIVRLGLDGIVFEESEEAYWFCNCDSCRQEYGEPTGSAAEAKHEANYRLLKTLHAVIKEERPACEVGLRAWREPPLEKTEEYLRHCRESIPRDVCLYWAPGLYVPESEFSKWVKVFGADRICARDTESNAWSSTQGRLIRIFQSNVLRSGEETNDQFIEKDIEQHRGSVGLHAGGRGLLPAGRAPLPGRGASGEHPHDPREPDQAFPGGLSVPEKQYQPNRRESDQGSAEKMAADRREAPAHYFLLRGARAVRGTRPAFPENPQRASKEQAHLRPLPGRGAV